MCFGRGSQPQDMSQGAGDPSLRTSSPGPVPNTSQPAPVAPTTTSSQSAARVDQRQLDEDIRDRNTGLPVKPASAQDRANDADTKAGYTVPVNRQARRYRDQTLLEG